MTGDLNIIQRSVDANGITFGCDECGFGDDVALLLHGFPECRISWRHQLVPLARLGWRVVAPDTRGYGDTTRPTDQAAYRLRHLVDDVAALFDALGARRKLLIGHDWGALIAWSVAIERAVPLDALIVMNVPHPQVFRRVIRHSWSQRLRSWYILFFQLPWLPEQALTYAGARAVERTFTGMAQNPDAFPPEILARYRGNALKPGAMTAMLNYYRANALAFVKSAPSEPVHVPTLMIWGEHDTALGLELTEGYDGLVDDFTLRRLPQASHWVQQDAPDAVNAALAEWLTARGLVVASNIAAARCRGCDVILTLSNDSEAHIIPNALGGRLKPKGIICQTCNGVLDRIADNPLVKAFGDWPTLMDIPRDRGANPPKVVTTREGKRVRLDPDGTLTRVDVTYEVQASSEESKIEIGAGDMKTIRQLLQRVKKQYPEFDTKAAEQFARTVGLQDDDELKLGLGFGRAQVFGGVVTALWLFLILKTGRAFMDLPKLQQVISTVQDHGGMFRYLPCGLPGLNGPDIPLGHKIVVRSVPATGELIGYVEILGIMRVGGIFARAGGPAVTIEHIYAYDVLARTDRSSEFWIDPAVFERQDWRNVGSGPTTTDTPALIADFEDKLEKVFVRRYRDRFSQSGPAP